MKILLVNKFFFLKGGAETSFFDTAEVLTKKGHEVIFFSMAHPANFESIYGKYFVSRVDFENTGSWLQQIEASLRILYSLEARKNLDELLKAEKPDIVHLHNIHHQISPSILHTLEKYNLPTVMTLHDYKMVCPVYTLFDRNGEICERCKGRKYYWCLIKRCNRGSALKSFLNTVEMYLHHLILHIYNFVDAFISPSLFLKEKVEELGFKGEVIHLPNFIRVDDCFPSFTSEEGSLVFFGRLSREKGLFTLLSAMKGLMFKCKIIGEGPLKERLRGKATSEGLHNVIFLGFKRGEELKDEIRKSAIVILPSEWHENNPLSVLETFALGKPVIASRIGGIPELVKDDQTGLTFQPGSAEDLREKILYLIRNPEKIIEMGKNGRKFVEEKLSPEGYYRDLIEIYQSAIEKKKRWKHQ